MQIKNTNRIILIIMDGWGHSEVQEGNAIYHAKTPNFDHYWKNYPHMLLKADGESVGLPEGQMGTSEVNHMTIGSGRIIFQDLVKINKAIREGSLEQNKAIIAAMEHVKSNNSTLHLKGLLSDGGVHSHQSHYYGLLDLAKKVGVKNVVLHIFTDGRDVSPKSAKKYVTELENYMTKIGLGRIATIGGRYYGMDRDNNWERIDLAFHAMVKGEGRKHKSALEAIEDSYLNGETDEFITPAVIESDEGEIHKIASNDAVIFVNFRSDRGVQMSQRFKRSNLINLNYTTMTQYRDDLDVNVAFAPESLDNILGEVISEEGINQLRITETEKYNHVTYFFNCKRNEPFPGEDRILLNSNSDVKTHDEKPEMRAYDITAEILEDIRKEKHQVIITNLVNPDMVGHTANMPAVIKAVETVDTCIGKICNEALSHDNYHVFITADHGNADELIDFLTNEPKTSHTLNPVPFILVSKNNIKQFKKDFGSLIDIAPTILSLLNIRKPTEMTGDNLL